MLFEEASRQHKRYEKVQEVLKLRDDLAREIGSLHGVAITPRPRPTPWSFGSCGRGTGRRRSV
jgi:hypothetical protein